MPSSHSGSDLSWHTGDSFSDGDSFSHGHHHIPNVIDDNSSRHSGDLFDSGRWIDEANPDGPFNLEDSINDNPFDGSGRDVPVTEPVKKYKDPFQDPICVLSLILLTLCGLGASLYFVKDSLAHQSDFRKNGAYDTSLLIDVCTDIIVFGTGIISTWMVNVGNKANAGPVFAAAWYVHRAYIIIECIEWTTGFGPSYEGDGLEAGAQQFTAIYEQLQSAFPDNSHWQGEGADAYADQLTALRGYLDDFASYDRQLKNLVENQAQWVMAVRLVLGFIKALVAGTAVYITEAARRYLPQYVELFGEAAKKAMNIAHTAPAVAVLALIVLLSASSDKCKGINRLTSHYDGISPEDAEKLSEPHIAAAQKTGVGGFDGIPSIAMLANLAGHTGNAAAVKQHRPFSGHLGDGDTADIGSAPGAQNFARLAAMSEQTAKFLNKARPQMDLIGQATAYKPPAGSTSPPAQKADTPAEPALVDGDENSPASAQAGQRAPVGVTEADAESRYPITL